MIKDATGPLVQNLTTAIMKQEDPELVRLGAPAYLLLIDGMVESYPDDPETLLNAAKLYSSYLGAFLMDGEEERAKKMARKAYGYALRGVKELKPSFYEIHDKPYEQFQGGMDLFQRGDEELLYALITTWAAVIQTDSGNYDRLAEISKIKGMARRLLEINEGYYYGAGHLVLAVLDSILPPALGGRPQKAMEHFQRAMELSEGKFLMAQVLTAQHIGRKTFDRALHDRLLKEVIEADISSEPSLILINTLAQQRAQQLLDDGKEYFE